MPNVTVLCLRLVISLLGELLDITSSMLLIRGCILQAPATS
jgi:hypothetical protein